MKELNEIKQEPVVNNPVPVTIAPKSISFSEIKQQMARNAASFMKQH